MAQISLKRQLIDHTAGLPILREASSASICLCEPISRHRDQLLRQPMVSRGRVEVVLHDDCCFDEGDHMRRLALQRPCQLNQGGQRWLPLPPLQHADVVALQLSLEAQLFLRQSGLLAQIAQNTSESERNVQ